MTTKKPAPPADLDAERRRKLLALGPVFSIHFYGGFGRTAFTRVEGVPNDPSTVRALAFDLHAAALAYLAEAYKMTGDTALLPRLSVLLFHAGALRVGTHNTPRQDGGESPESIEWMLGGLDEAKALLLAEGHEEPHDRTEATPEFNG